MSNEQGPKSGQSGAQRKISRRSNQGSVPRDVKQPMFSKRMQVYAYTATTVILVGLLFGVGYLYKTKQVESTDSILMFILAQILGAWVGLTNKIFRIPTIGSDKNPE